MNNQSKIKIASLQIASVVLAFAFGYLFAQFISTTNYWYLLYTVIAAFLYLALFLIKSLVISSWKLSLPFIILDAVAIVLPFWQHLTLWIMVSGAIATILLIAAYWRCRSELQNMNVIGLSRFYYTVVFLSFLATNFLAVAIYISLINIDNFQIGKEPIYLLTRSSENLVQRFFPRFSADAPVEVVLVDVVKQQTGQPLPADALQLALRNLQRVISDATGGITVDLQDSITEAIQKVVNIKIQKSPDNIKVSILLALGLIVFLIINGGAFIFTWVIGFLAWIIYKILLATKFINIKLENVQKEVITI